MQGYWGDPEKTGRSLVPDPLGAHQGSSVYRTGDLVVENEAGDLQLLGRRDHQIKSRGYRVELGDIESALYAHPKVTECAIVAVPDPMITNRIKAYAVVRDGIDRQDLVRFCALRLPRPMVPDTFVFLDALPKTSTGKIDRQALLATEDRTEGG
jgi:acyl-coenzyme A synthetase/AMP-(fatty) acid ligase